MYHRRRYSRYDYYISIAVVLVVAVAKFWILHPVATTVIACIVIIFTLFGNKFLIEHDYKNSIKDVRKSLVSGHNTVSNAHCTAKFYPDDKLIVMENIPDSDNKKRMFTLTVKDKFKVNKCWSNVCRVFDDYSNIKSLALLLDVPDGYIITLESTAKQTPKTPQPKHINIDNSKCGPKFVNMDEICPDPYSKGTESPRIGGEKFVNINNIQEAPKVTEREIEAPKFVEMGEALNAGPNKIDINTATAADIAILPGINIVKAKKIIEYRDKQGLFKTEEDFFKQANVKEHFIEKIKSMIIVTQPEQTNHNEDEEEQGRIVDL